MSARPTDDVVMQKSLVREWAAVTRHRALAVDVLAVVRSHDKLVEIVDSLVLSLELLQGEKQK